MGWYGFSGGLVGAQSDGGQASSAGTSPTITVTRTWQGVGSPPKKVYILETAGASGGGGVYGPGGNGSGSADDGLGDAPVTSADGSGQTSSGKHLLQVDGSSGTVSRSSSPTAAGTTAASPGGFSGLSMAMASFGWDFDTRGLTLTRDGAINETTDDDGTVHGDTIYSYQDTEPATSSPFGITMEVTGPVDNWLMFHPNFQGGWSTKAFRAGYGTGSDYDVAWSWSPSESQDDLHDGQWKMPYGSMNKVDGTWVGHPTGASPGSVMTYTATDNQNPATATAQYILTVHDVNEKQPDVVDDPHHLFQEIDGSIWANNTGESETVTVHTDRTHINVASFAAGGTIGIDWLKSFGLDVNGTATWESQVWDNTNIGGSQAFTLPPNTYIYPITRVFSYHQEFWVKSYDAGGYTGQAYQRTDSFNGDQSIEYTTSPILDEPGYMR